jgi:MSHA biogenesis protein MshQ
VYSATYLNLDTYSGNLSAGETTASGAGTVIDGVSSNDDNLNSLLSLSKPGAGNDGSVDLHYDLSGAGIPWLQYDWDNDGTHDDNPTARATFGIYKGNKHIIYIRETTWR